MMRVKCYKWLCEDCMFAAVNADYSGISCATRAAEEALVRRIKRGLRRLPPIVPAFYDGDRSSDDEDNPDVDFDFTEPCACCGLYGLRYRNGYRFAVLVKASKRYQAVHSTVEAALSAMDGCALDDDTDRERVLDTIMTYLSDAKLT